MNSETIREMLYGQPFEPFEICMSDGRRFEVRHPELAIVAADHVAVGSAGPEPEIASRIHLLALRHVTSTAPLASQ